MIPEVLALAILLACAAASGPKPKAKLRKPSDNTTLLGRLLDDLEHGGADQVTLPISTIRTLLESAHRQRS